MNAHKHVEIVSVPDVETQRLAASSSRYAGLCEGLLTVLKKHRSLETYKNPVAMKMTLDAIIAKLESLA